MKGGASQSSMYTWTIKNTKEDAMLDKTQMQEIQDLKLRGYTKSEIRTYYEQQGRKPPSRPTISKY